MDIYIERELYIIIIFLYIYRIFLYKGHGVYYFGTALRCGVYSRVAFIKLVENIYACMQYTRTVFRSSSL